jgi:peptidoglycan hydrolase-like protein with peptidoglycan-binding domain
MENRLMSFGEFNSLYESYGFINEAEDKSIFNPANPTANKKEIAEIFATAGATNEAGNTLNDYKPVVKGEKGARVIEVQKYLGINPADGIFGPATEAKVKEFQKANKLTIDGKVGVQTLRKMMSLKGNVKDVKKQDQIIIQKFVVKTAQQAKAAGIDPKMLLIFDRVVVTKNGDKTYVICYPKKDAAQTVKTLDGKGLLKANWEWMKNAASAVGKALLYTVTGVFVLAAETANAIISGVVSAGAWVAKGAMTAVGAVAQGLATVTDWAAKGAKAAYKKVLAWSTTAWNNFSQSAGKVMKASVQAFTAFLDGVKAAAKTTAYVLTGAAITAWRGIKSVFSAAVKSIVETAKDGAAFVKKGLDWIGKNVKNGAQAFAKTIKAGWDATVSATKTALAAGASLIKSGGEALVSAYNTVSKGVSDGLNYLYNMGKSFWESEEYADFFGDDIVFEDLDWSMDFDLNSDEFGYEMA